MRVAFAALLALLVFVPRSQPEHVSRLEQEPACQSLMPAAAGGPLPRNPTSSSCGSWACRTTSWPIATTCCCSTRASTSSRVGAQQHHPRGHAKHVNAIFLDTRMASTCGMRR